VVCVGLGQGWVIGLVGHERRDGAAAAGGSQKAEEKGNNASG